MVESKKSTLRFTAKELDLILLFLHVNFKEKLEFLPLIKKVRAIEIGGRSTLIATCNMFL